MVAEALIASVPDAVAPLRGLVRTVAEPRRRPARDAAEMAAQRSFLRMVSHELRTPLNAIIGFSEILSCELYGPLGAPQYREYAGIVKDSGHQLLKLVNQTLEIVRLESGAAELDAGPELLEPAVADAIAAAREDAGAVGVTVQLAGLVDLPPVLADARGLRTMLGNLLQNALSASPADGVVTVRARALTGRIVIEIQDRGEGCDPADLPRLMRPFVQGENALSRKTTGAGLGLPIVRLLAEASGGQLRLRSSPGAGFTAILTLPRA